MAFSEAETVGMTNYFDSVEPAVMLYFSGIKEQMGDTVDAPGAGFVSAQWPNPTKEHSHELYYFNS